MRDPGTSIGLEAVLIPRAHGLGGFEVRRALPSRERQMAGPFVFFDQMGPGEFLTGCGLDVRAHPHNTSMWDTLEHAKQMDTFQPMLDSAKRFAAMGVTFERPIMDYGTLWHAPGRDSGHQGA